MAATKEFWFEAPARNPRDLRVVHWKGWVALMAGAALMLIVVLLGIEAAARLFGEATWVRFAALTLFSILGSLPLAGVVGFRARMR